MPNKHIHKYERAKLGTKYLIYRCMWPGCTHYIAANLISNRECICWRCGEVFIIKKGHVQKNPVCEGCIRRKKPNEKVAGVDLDHFLQSLLDKEGRE